MTGLGSPAPRNRGCSGGHLRRKAVVKKRRPAAAREHPSPTPTPACAEAGGGETLQPVAAGRSDSVPGGRGCWGLGASRERRNRGGGLARVEIWGQEAQGAAVHRYDLVLEAEQAGPGHLFVLARPLARLQPVAGLRAAGRQPPASVPRVQRSRRRRRRPRASGDSPAGPVASCRRGPGPGPGSSPVPGGGNTAGAPAPHRALAPPPPSHSRLRSPAGPFGTVPHVPYSALTHTPAGSQLRRPGSAEARDSARAISPGVQPGSSLPFPSYRARREARRRSRDHWLERTQRLSRERQLFCFVPRRPTRGVPLSARRTIGTELTSPAPSAGHKEDHRDERTESAPGAAVRLPHWRSHAGNLPTGPGRSG